MESCSSVRPRPSFTPVSHTQTMANTAPSLAVDPTKLNPTDNLYLPKKHYKLRHADHYSKFDGVFPDTHRFCQREGCAMLKPLSQFTKHAMHFGCTCALYCNSCMYMVNRTTHEVAHRWCKMLIGDSQCVKIIGCGASRRGTAKSARRAVRYWETKSFRTAKRTAGPSRVTVKLEPKQTQPNTERTP